MERSLRLNIAAGFFGMFWICAPLGAPLPLLMQVVGASSAQLGLLSAAWQAAMLAQIPAAFLAEALGRRKPMWATVTIAHRILWASPAVVPWLFPNQRERWPVLIIAALALSNLLANLGTASWSSWMADIVPAETAGRFWTVRQRVLSYGLILGTVMYGWLLDRPQWSASLVGFQWVFALCSVFGILDIVVHCFVHEPVRHRSEAASPRGAFWERLRAPFRVPGFLPLTVLMAVWTGAQSLVGYNLAMPGFFSMVHLRESFGATYTQASLIFIGAAVGAALFATRLGPWMDRSGAGTVLTRLVVFGPVSMMAWWLAAPGQLSLGGNDWPKAVLWMAFAALAQGVFYTGSFLCQFRLTQMCTLPEGRTLAMAVHWSIAGLGGALGAFLGGWLKGELQAATWPAWLGRAYPFDALVLLHVLTGWVVVLPLCRWLSQSLSGSAARASL